MRNFGIDLAFFKVFFFSVLFFVYFIREFERRSAVGFVFPLVFRCFFVFSAFAVFFLNSALLAPP